MANDRLTGQLTVGELKRIIATADDDSVVGLVVPVGGIGDQKFTTYFNVKVESNGPMVMIKPQRDSMLGNTGAESPK